MIALWNDRRLSPRGPEFKTCCKSFFYFLFLHSWRNTDFMSKKFQNLCSYLWSNSIFLKYVIVIIYAQTNLLIAKKPTISRTVLCSEMGQKYIGIDKIPRWVRTVMISFTANVLVGKKPGLSRFTIVEPRSSRYVIISVFYTSFIGGYISWPHAKVLLQCEIMSFSFATSIFLFHSG